MVEIGQLMHGLSYDEYAAIGGLRASDLHRLKRSPAHYRAMKTQQEGEKKSDALAFGKLFHYAIEQPERFRDTYRVEPVFEGRTKKGERTTSPNSAEVKIAKAEWYRDLPPGTLVVKQSWVDPLLGMLDSCLNHRLVGNLVRNGVRETSLVVEDPDTGVLLQCRPDFISERGFMVDFKTTRNAKHPFFYNQIFSSRYDEDPFYVLASAHYTHCARVARLPNVRNESMTLIAIEKEPPYAIMLWPLDVGCLAPGEQWRAELTRLYATCRQSDRWPSYEERAQAVVPPLWVELPGGTLE